MDRTRTHLGRAWRGLETLVYVAGGTLLLALTAALVFGWFGAVWAVVLALVAVVWNSEVPIHAVLRLRGARPLHPREAPELYAQLADLSRRAGLGALPVLYLSPRREPEAFTIVSRSASAITVSVGLLHLLDAREVRGVLAHEVAHIRARDPRLLAYMHSLRNLTGTVALFGWATVALAFLGLVPLGPLPLLPLLLVVPSFSLAVLMAASRSREYAADLVAAELTSDPRALASALARIEHVHTHLLWVAGIDLDQMLPPILRTHPPSAERVRRLMALVPSRVVRLRPRPVRERASPLAA